MNPNPSTELHPSQDASSASRTRIPARNGMAAEPVVIRCSSLWLYERCPQALRIIPGEPIVSGSLDAANLGSAAHEIVTSTVAERPVDTFEVAARWNVDREELSMLEIQSWRLWSQVKEFFPFPQVEQAVEQTISGNVVLRGHIDVLSHKDDDVMVADFKTGRLDSDHSAQIKAYAWLAAVELQTERAYTAVLRVRDGIIDGQWYTRDELESWIGGLLERIAGDESYRPGSHCRFCPRSATCPAKTAMLKQAHDVIKFESSALEKDALPVQDNQRGAVFSEILDYAASMNDMIETARDLIKADIAARGPAITGDGRRIELHTVDQREILSRPALPIIMKEIGAAGIDAAKFSVSKIEKLVSDSAPRGQKGKMAQAFMGLLEEAGALTTKSIQRLEIRQHKEESINDGSNSQPAALPGPENQPS